MTFKNMKIPVENNLDEIVVELEKRGYVLNFKLTDNPVCITIKINKSYGFFDFMVSDTYFKPTTLAELKEM